MLKVSYKLTATYNKTYTVLEKFCPTASVNVNILEDINVEKDGLLGEKKMEKELKLSNKKKARVYVNIGKRAAVKGNFLKKQKQSRVYALIAFIERRCGTCNCQN